MAQEDRLTTLYEWSEAMSKAGDAVKEKHEDDYKKIIDYVKTSENTRERIMAAQLVAKFFKYFDALQEAAFDSIVDLCESADVDVRKHATMAMITICSGSKQIVSKAADILIQLYQTNQPSEVNLINQSLATLLNLNIEQFLKSFFANFEDGSEIVRERALKFLMSRIHTVSELELTKEIEEQLLNYTKKAMEDVTKDEFISFIGILSKLKIAKTSTGQASLVAAIKSQAELGKEFNPQDQEFLDKFLLCTMHTIPFLSQYNRASEYVKFICLKMLPRLSEMAQPNDLAVLEVLALMSPFIILDDSPNLIDLDECHKAVHNKLLEFLPLPPESTTIVPHLAAATTQAEQTVEATEPKETKTDGDGQTPAAAVAESETPQTIATSETQATTTEAGAASTKPTETSTGESGFQFTHIEYLMYTFVQLCRLKPELYTEAMQVENRKKLSHLSNGCKKFTDSLERQMTSVKATDLNKEENMLRSRALRTTKNISTMILGLFKKPADFRTSITLSCKKVRVESSPPAGDNGNANNNNNNNDNGKQHIKPKHGGVYVGPNQRNNQRSGGYNGNNQHQRQAGQKSKFKGNYQSSDNRGKRPRR